MVPLKREVSHTHVLIPDPVYDEYAVRPLFTYGKLDTMYGELALERERVLLASFGGTRSISFSEDYLGARTTCEGSK
jgi:hypothetical protein